MSMPMAVPAAAFSVTGTPGRPTPSGAAAPPSDAMPTATRSATTVEMVLRDSPVRRASSARETVPACRSACSTSARLRSRSASSEPGAALSSRIAAQDI